MDLLKKLFRKCYTLGILLVLGYFGLLFATILCLFFGLVAIPAGLTLGLLVGALVGFIGVDLDWW